jgi:dienelactone hydrolase
MKRQISILLHLLLVLALCACGVVPASPSPTPSPTATTRPTQLPDPVEEIGSCPSGEVAAPDIVDTWSPPPEAEGITPLSCNEIGAVFAYDPQAPLDIQEVSRRWEEGVTIIDLTYASPMGGRVPATLVVPDGDGPFAGMLYQHGMPSTRQPLIPTAVIYARMGAIVLLIDAPFARRADGLNRPTTFTEQDRREQIQLIVDLRRGIDLLLSRPEVDPERLAYVAASYGGAMGGLLAGVEHRLKAYVLVVGDGGLVTNLTGLEDRASWLAIPESERRQWVAWMWPIEPIHYVGCASPAALLFQNGTLDTFSTPAGALRYQEAASEPKTIYWYRAGHALNIAAFEDRLEWLAEMIGITAGPPAVPVDPQILAAYGGRYQLSDGHTMTICGDGTRIFLQVPNEPGFEAITGEYELLAASEDHFFLGVSDSDIDIAFYRNASGEVDRFVFVASGVTYEAKKVP